MRWEGREQSENVEDRRGMPVRGAAVGGMGTVVILLIAWFLGADPRALLQQVQQQQGVQQGPAAPNPKEDKLKELVAVVLKDTEDVWTEQFRKAGRQYKKPTLVVFKGRVESHCGLADAAMGPFYCPADEKVYIDLAFFEELSRRFGAPGDFAIAYVVAHEIGHHVQNLLGTSDKVHAARGRVNQREYNQLSVKLELQADFLAGVFAHHADKSKRILEAGDVEEAMKAAQAVGDDAIQKATRGQVVPDSFTHGSSKQRAKWFMLGLKTGDVSAGDTFNAPDL